MTADARKMILRMLQEGKITLEEADQLLSATVGAKEAPKAAESKSKNIFDQVVGGVESTIGTIKTGVEAGKVLDSIGKKINSVVTSVSQAWESGMDSVVANFQDGERFELAEQVGIPLNEKVTQISVTNLKGNVTLIGEDRKDLALKITKFIYAANQEDAEKKSGNLHINPQQVGDRLKIDVPETTRSVFQKESIDLECRIPRNLLPTVATDTGSVTVRDMQFGDQEADIKTVSGHLTLEKLTGALKVQTVSGAMNLKQCIGKWQLKSVSGDITIGEARLAGTINSNSGKLRLNGLLQGQLQFHSMSGDFSGDLTVGADSGLEATTTSGRLDLHLQEGSDVQVTGVTLAGSVTCSANLDGKEVEKNQMKGRMGSGAGQVSLRSTSGSIEIK